jgi:hypothetical protein
VIERRDPGRMGVAEPADRHRGGVARQEQGPAAVAVAVQVDQDVDPVAAQDLAEGLVVDAVDVGPLVGVMHQALGHVVEPQARGVAEALYLVLAMGLQDRLEELHQVAFVEGRREVADAQGALGIAVERRGRGGPRDPGRVAALPLAMGFGQVVGRRLRSAQQVGEQVRMQGRVVRRLVDGRAVAGQAVAVPAAGGQGAGETAQVPNLPRLAVQNGVKGGDGALGPAAAGGVLGQQPQAFHVAGRQLELTFAVGDRLLKGAFVHLALGAVAVERRAADFQVSEKAAEAVGQQAPDGWMGRQHGRDLGVEQAVVDQADPCLDRRQGIGELLDVGAQLVRLFDQLDALERLVQVVGDQAEQVDRLGAERVLPE